MLDYYRKSGTEGPRHDPYGYTEITARRNGHAVTLHTGLAVWLKVNGEMFDAKITKEQKLLLNQLTDEWELCTVWDPDHSKKEFEAYIVEFERLIGFTPKQMERWERKARSRCRCGSKEFKYVDGYPGEHFTMCVKCDNIVNTYFNESEII